MFLSLKNLCVVGLFLSLTASPFSTTSSTESEKSDIPLSPRAKFLDQDAKELDRIFKRQLRLGGILKEEKKKKKKKTSAHAHSHKKTKSLPDSSLTKK